MTQDTEEFSSTAAEAYDFANTKILKKHIHVQ
jgi:hypothetical protein